MTERRDPRAYQAMRYRPMEIDEDVKKTSARYGSIEEPPADDPAAPSLDEEYVPGRAYAGRPGEKGKTEHGRSGGTPESLMTEAEESDADTLPYDDPLYRDGLDGDEDYVPSSRGGSKGRTGVSAGGQGPGKGEPIPEYEGPGRARPGGATIGAPRLSGKAAGTGAVPGSAAAGSGGKSSAGARMMSALADRAMELGDSERDAEGAETVQSRPLRSGRRLAARFQRSRKAITAAGSAVGRAAEQVSDLLSRKAKIVIGVQAAKLGLIALLLFLPVLLVILLVSAITFKSADVNAVKLNETYEYITRLDAELEQRLLGLGSDGIETVYLINGMETAAESVQIRSDTDWILLYLDSAYERSALEDEIKGAFGQTVEAELSGLHARMYVWDEELIGSEPEEGTEVQAQAAEPAPSEEPEPAQQRIVRLTVRTASSVLNEAGAVSEDTAELMSTVRDLGIWSVLERLRAPFDGAWYIAERSGWYRDSGDGTLRRREGVTVNTLAGAGTEVLSCLQGTVLSAGSGRVVVESPDGAKTEYGQLTSISVGAGQQVAQGERLGEISANLGLYLVYRPEGAAVSPAFFLPSAGVLGTAADLVSAAASQLGNIGGEQYWRWYGFDEHVDWCAIFVSWCAAQCGYIERGAIPRFAGCTTGSGWFKARGLWQGRDYVPQPGELIFFDWDNNFEADGTVDHVGIVVRVEGNVIHTIEGNSGDRCRERQYPIGDARIHGYGIPAV